MDCKYKDSLVPRCEIVTHPDRPNVEYCKICREWDYLDQVGGFSLDSTNFFWLLIATGLIVFMLQSESARYRSPDPSPGSNAAAVERTYSPTRRRCLSRNCYN
jgi:hypothetical protein